MKKVERKNKMRKNGKNGKMIRKFENPINYPICYYQEQIIDTINEIINKLEEIEKKVRK
jgi:hypothetical protein